MKIAFKHPFLQPRLKALLEDLQDYWDEDIQQRALEYLQLLKQAEHDPEAHALMLVALEPMPTFSDSLQQNNILLRRIMKLKVSQSLSEEAEAKGNLKYYESAMSEALSTNKPQTLAGIDLSGVAPKKISVAEIEHHEEEAKDVPNASFQTPFQSADLLSFDPAPVQKQPDLLGFDDLALLGSSKPRHKFYVTHADRFSPEQTVQMEEQNPLQIKDEQDQYWKALLPFSTTARTVFKNQTIEAIVEFQAIKYLGRFLLTFPPGVSQMQVSLDSDNNAKTECKGVKEGPNGTTQVLIMAMLI